MSSRARALAAVISVVSASSLVLSGCGSDKAPPKPTKASVSVAANGKLNALVPASIKQKGQLVMATDPTYPPIEFSKSGASYQGLDIDLANAIGKVLSIKVVIDKVPFAGIVAGIDSGRYDFSLSAFTDTPDGEKGNDFVTYLSAGTSIGVKKGNPNHIGSQDDLCGRKVGAGKGRVQAAMLTKKVLNGAPTVLGRCLDAGKSAPIPVLLPDPSGANLAVASGRVDAFLADTPVLGYAATLAGSQLQVVGTATDKAAYGIVLKRGSVLSSLFQKAVTQLMTDGTYQQIVERWKLKSAAITDSKINGAH